MRDIGAAKIPFNGGDLSMGEISQLGRIDVFNAARAQNPRPWGTGGLMIVH